VEILEKKEKLMRSLIESLKERDALQIVTKKVNPKFELAAVTKAVQQSSNKAVFFENVLGSDLPVITNIYNSRQELSRFIGAEPEMFCAVWNSLYSKTSAQDHDSIKVIDRPLDLVDRRLSDLPLITYHEEDVGPYFTSAIFLAKSPETNVENLSFHRGMYVSDKEIRIRLGSSHDLYRYQAAAEADGNVLDAVMLIGTEPSLFVAAGATLPEEWSELSFASAINSAPILCYPARGSDLLIPASAQVVIEGKILPNEKKPEGPFGEFQGYYVDVGDNNIFEVQHVYTQSEPIYHSLLCGSPEDISLLEARVAANTYRHLQESLPGILDVACTPSVMNTTIKIKQQYEGHARQVLMTAFGAHLDYNQVCIVVDEDVNIFDLNEVMWAFVTRGRVDERTLIIPEVPGFYRDKHKDYWGRLGLDATYPFERSHEFRQKRVPGEADIDLTDYLKEE